MYHSLAHFFYCYARKERPVAICLFSYKLLASFLVRGRYLKVTWRVKPPNFLTRLLVSFSYYLSFSFTLSSDAQKSWFGFTVEILGKFNFEFLLNSSSRLGYYTKHSGKHKVKKHLTNLSCTCGGMQLRGRKASILCFLQGQIYFWRLKDEFSVQQREWAASIPHAQEDWHQWWERSSCN